MITLENLERSDFPAFKSWINDQDSLFQFAGQLFTFPLTDEQLERYITDPRRKAFKVLLSGTTTIGNAELNFENPLPRLSRILIGNAENRNKGLGKQIVHNMLEKLFIEADFAKADLNVFDWNKAGIHCYQQVGFVINPDVINQQNNNGVVWTALNMTITKENWLAKKQR